MIRESDIQMYIVARTAGMDSQELALPIFVITVDRDLIGVVEK